MGQSGLVDEDRVLLFHSHSRTSAPDVAGDGEQVLYVNHGERFLGSLMSCLFQIQFAVYGNRKYKIAIGGTYCNESFEHFFVGNSQKRGSLLASINESHS